MAIRRLNKREGYGCIHPPYQPEHFDRPAAFAQGTRYFDVHGREIVPGVPIDPNEPFESLDTEGEGEAGNPGGGDLPLSALIAQAERMPFEHFRAAAAAILGEEAMPRTRAQILTRLRAVDRGDKTAIALTIAARAEARMQRAAKAVGAVAWPPRPNADAAESGSSVAATRLRKAAALEAETDNDEPPEAG